MGFVAPTLLQEWSITRPQLAPVLAATLVGMALGAILMGPIGDKLGRRSALILSMSVVAVGSLLSAYANTPGELTAYHLITGLGLGGSLPNATSLMMELARQRAHITELKETVAVCSDDAPTTPRKRQQSKPSHPSRLK